MDRSIGYQRRMINELVNVHDTLLSLRTKGRQIREKGYDEMSYDTRQQFISIFEGYGQHNKKFKGFLDEME